MVILICHPEEEEDAAGAVDSRRKEVNLICQDLTEQDLQEWGL